jgi:hypothetical protein
MTVKRVAPLKRILARLTGRPRTVEPTHEHIIKQELRSLLERDCYLEAIDRLESSPDHLVALVELLRNRDLELPGMATLSQLAKRGADISKTIDALTARLLCDDLNISSYASRALTHYHLVRGNLEEVDVLFSSGISSVQYGSAEALREAIMMHNVIATDFAIRRVFSDSKEIQEYAAWALKGPAELDSKDVRKTISELTLHRMKEIKNSDNARLDVYRILSQIHELASPKEE